MTKPEGEDQGDSDDDLDSGAMRSDKIEERFGNNDEPYVKSDLLEGRAGGHYWKHPLSNSLFNTFNEYIKN